MVSACLVNDIHAVIESKLISIQMVRAYDYLLSAAVVEAFSARQLDEPGKKSLNALAYSKCILYVLL
jgi:hypothetical protein